MRTNETNNTMVAKILRAHAEIEQLDSIVSNLITTLESASKTTNYDICQNIGKYARNMPRCKIFVSHVDYLKTCIRKICTGEVSIDIALQKASELHNSIQEVLTLFNTEAINKYKSE